MGAVCLVATGGVGDVASQGGSCRIAHTTAQHGVDARKQRAWFQAHRGRRTARPW